ncbi:MAG: DUF58 domain-containing protein [Deltaproteobacteria bacterium]|nr:DUF58 domain-containing protein [Deltaproteobacteria bacterium]
MVESSSPLSPEVLSRLSGLKVQVQRVVEGVLAGLHRSARHGVSIEFAEHKEYAPGDDPRHLDWRVLGRLDRYYIKKYEDETNLQASLALDMSGSMGYGSGPFTKAEYAALLTASLAALVLRQGDASGLILLGGSRPTHLPPVARPEHLGDIVQAIEAARAQGPTDLQQAAKIFVERSRRRGMLVLLSDLFDPAPDVLASYKMVAARGHEVVVFHVLDPDELDFPFEDPSQFESMEDERRVLAFPREVKQAYLKELQVFMDQTRRSLAEAGMCYELVRTDEPPHQPLIRHLTRRKAVRRWS